MSRLIDADALLDRIPNLYERREVSRWVDEAPTVDAVPVVHGRWVTDGMMMDCGEYLMTRCTACGTPFEYGYDMPYCPQCGAKMDGKEVDNGQND